MDNEKMHSDEYVKSRFRCPICGQLAGCSKDGKIGMFSAKMFSRHVNNCRWIHRTDPGRIRYGDSDG